MSDPDRWAAIVDGDPDEQERVWELFHENSKTHRFSETLDDAAVAALMVELWEDLPYPSAEPVELPPASLPRAALADAMLARRTATSFGSGPVTLEPLSSLLAAGYGTTNRPSAVGERRFRTVPSAGALYPLELYVHARAIVGLDPGLYHFQATRHRLQRLRAAADDQLVATFVQPDLIGAAAAVVLITAVFARGTFKYGERGYRFALIEAGHVAQNINLVAAALGLGSTNVGGFFDRELEGLLGIDGVGHSLLYAVALGSNPTGEHDNDAHPAA